MKLLFKTDYLRRKFPKSLIGEDEEYVNENIAKQFLFKEDFVKQVSTNLDSELKEFDEIEDGRYTNFCFIKLHILDFCCCISI